ncbi:MAG: murein biosynthesis integral membrane protein MurJ [Deltaproteobacteria bacterium]|nr:murein biosynthesis integral membrane protein MurJ [Deltaproteobacteria bacterium]
MSEESKLTKAAWTIGSATLLSRILGFIRDMVIAGFFGAGYASDIFFVAFKIPNILRSLFAEGSLSVAFIPVFTQYITTDGKKKAFNLAQAALIILSVLLIFITILGIAASPFIVKIMAPGFISYPDKIAHCINLTRIMFPYIFLIGLVGLCMGILNTLGHFAAPALAPVFLNLGMITSVFISKTININPVYCLAYGVIAGGILQLILQIPFIIKYKIPIIKKPNLSHPGIKKIGKLMLPSIFGSAVYQINIIIGTMFASLLPEGSISYLYYADRLVQFPLGIFAIAAATALLPSLSRQAVLKDYEGLKKSFAYTLKLILFITLPASVGLIVLKEPIVSLLFERGVFDSEAVKLTAYALLSYSIGLWAFSCVKITVSTFYSISDTKTPVKIAAISIGSNIVLSFILMKFLSHSGLALAASLSSMINLTLLIIFLRKKIGRLGGKTIVKSGIKSLICSLIMGIVLWFFLFFIQKKSVITFMLIYKVGLLITAGVIIYIAVSCILNRNAVKNFGSVIKKRG